MYHLWIWKLHVSVSYNLMLNICIRSIIECPLNSLLEIQGQLCTVWVFCACAVRNCLSVYRVWDKVCCNYLVLIESDIWQRKYECLCPVEGKRFSMKIQICAHCKIPTNRSMLWFYTGHKTGLKTYIVVDLTWELNHIINIDNYFTNLDLFQTWLDNQDVS